MTATGPDGATTRTVTVTVAGTAPRPQRRRKPQRRQRRRFRDSPTASPIYPASTAPTATCASSASSSSKPGAESFRVVEATERDAGTGDDCLPPGVPAATMLPFPFQIVHTPDTLAILYEAYHQFRIAPIGREHAEYLAPGVDGPLGGALGRRHARRRRARLQRPHRRSPGHRHTEELRVIERYRRTAYDTIEYEADRRGSERVRRRRCATSGTLTLHPEWEIGEYVCAENNQDYDELFEAD